MDPVAMAIALRAQAQASNAALVAAAVAQTATAAAAPPKPVTEDEGTGVAEEITEIFSDYKPSIKIGCPHPSPVVESGLLGTVHLPPITYKPDGVPAETISNGRLSSLQLESVLLAGQRHLLVRDGVRAGFFLGDGTGVGKGRQIAAIILDNIVRGRKKHLWVTTSPDLRQEAEHDFADIGAPSVLVRDVSQLDESCKKAMGQSAEFKDPPTGMTLFLTYSMLTGNKRLGGGKSTSRVDQLVEWLVGSGSIGMANKWDGCIIFDEAHRAKNFKIGEKEEQSTKMSLAVVELQAKLPLARVVYASATGIESLDHMGYATRMGLWGNPSFNTFQAFHDSFIKRGVGALELLAVEMKISSSFVSRSLSWKDAEFDLVEVPLSPEQRRLYRECSTLFFDLRSAVARAMAITGEGGANSPMKMFWSVQQRFFRDLINSFKVDYIVKECERAIAADMCVVIGLQSTGESGLNAGLEEHGSVDYSGKQVVAELISAPRQSLLSFLDKHFPTVPKYVPEIIPSHQELVDTAALYHAKGLPYDLQAKLLERAGMIERASQPPPTPLPIQELIDLKTSLKERVRELHVPPSPLDTLIDRLGGPSKVAEMTGRRGRLVRTKDGNAFVYETREQGGGTSSRGGGTNLAGDGCDSVNIKERQAFMDGRKLVGIISDAASTGISLHASINGAKNQRRRVHMTLELGWSADKTLQQLGRTHRSHQRTAPAYQLLMTPLGGEKRFASAVAKRLLSLGALTRGDRRAATVMDFSALNYDSKSGNKALRRLLSHASHLPEEMLSCLRDLPPVPDVDLSDSLSVSTRLRELVNTLELESGGGDKAAPVRRFLNRILMLPEEEQNLLFALFAGSLEATIRAEKQAGKYDEGTTSLRASSLRLVGEAEVLWEDEGATGAKVEAFSVQTDRGVSFDAALQEYERFLEEEEGVGSEDDDEEEQEDGEEDGEEEEEGEEEGKAMDEDDSDDDLHIIQAGEEGKDDTTATAAATATPAKGDKMDDTTAGEEEKAGPSSTPTPAKRRSKARTPSVLRGSKSRAGFYEMRGELYGRRLYVLAIPKATSPHMAFITRPNTGKSPIEMSFHDLQVKYRRLQDPQAAKAGWDFIYEHTEHKCIHFHGCKVRGCGSGSRMQQLALVGGALVPVWAALENTVAKYGHGLLTAAEAQLRVVCANLDDGRRLVGVKLPNDQQLMMGLREEIKALLSGFNGGRSVVEAVVPVDDGMMRKVTNKKRTMLSFFSKQPTSGASSAATGKKPAPAPPAKKQKVEAPSACPAAVIDLSAPSTSGGVIDLSDD